MSSSSDVDSDSDTEVSSVGDPKMEHRSVADLWPELLTELTVVPGPPQFLAKQNTKMNAVLGHGCLIEAIQTTGLKGLFIRPDETAGPGKKVKHCPIFIPAPHFSTVYLIKQINSLPSVGSNDTLEAIFSSIYDQVKGEILAKYGVSLVKHVKIIVIVSPKIFLSVEKILGRLFQSKLGEIAFSFTKNLRQFNPFVNDRGIKDSYCPREIYEMITSMKSEEKTEIEIYRLLREPAEIADGMFVELTDVPRVLSLQGTILQLQKETAANFLLHENILFHITEHGKLDNFESGRNYFLELFLRKNAYSLLSRDCFTSQFTSRCLQKIFTNPQISQFSISSLLFGSRYMVALSIGFSKSPEKPQTAVQNKIRQMVRQNIPRMQLVVYSLCSQYDAATAEQNYQNIIENHLMFCICLPNVSVTKLEEILRSNDEMATLLKSFKKQTTSGQKVEILFWLFETFEGEFLFKMDSDTSKLETTQLSITTLSNFHDEISTKEPECFQYVRSVLAASMCDREKPNSYADIDAVYLKSAQLRMQKTQIGVQLPTKTIVSPQQLRIIREKQTRLLLQGEPGAGQTNILLAFCETLISDGIKSIMYVFPDHKKKFGSWLKDRVDKTFTEKEKERIIIEPIGEKWDILQNWWV